MIALLATHPPQKMKLDDKVQQNLILTNQEPELKIFSFWFQERSLILHQIRLSGQLSK